MCYLIAKDTKIYGCYALKTTHGKQLVQMKRELNAAVAHNCYVIIENVPCMKGEQCGEEFFSTSVPEHIDEILERLEKNSSPHCSPFMHGTFSMIT